ncbi:MAG: HAD family hydrolase [Anaerovoracaceae bacterium]
MTVKGAIFDLDGTLFDSMKMWRTLASRYIKSLGKNPAPDVDRYIFNMSIEEGVHHLKEEYDIDGTPETLQRELLKIAHDFYMTDIEYKPGAEELLKELKADGIPMCIATATDREVIEPALKKIGCLDYFDGMFTCSEVNAGKRESVIYDASLELLGTPKAETLVFEDHFYAAQTAHNAGYPVIGIYEKYSTHEGEDLHTVCDFYLDSYANWPGLDEVAKILKL